MVTPRWPWMRCCCGIPQRLCCASICWQGPLAFAWPPSTPVAIAMERACRIRRSSVGAASQWGQRGVACRRAHLCPDLAGSAPAAQGGLPTGLPMADRWLQQPWAAVAILVPNQPLETSPTALPVQQRQTWWTQQASSGWGSAQRWQRGRLLQHGEIVLDPPTALWQRVFGEPAPTPAPPGVPRSGLDHHLQKAFMQHWCRQNWILQPLDHEELQELKEEASSPSL